jgi:hypothetical protein
MDEGTIRNRDFMKNIAFIADFYSNEINGGGESNDSNLINCLKKNNKITCYKTSSLSPVDLEDKDVVIVGNFIMMPREVMKYLIDNKKYIIYEHDHKYVTTRDPSKFKDFKIPNGQIIFKDFYQNAHTVVVLSKICQQVLNDNIDSVNICNIGCSLWSDKKFDLLKKLCKKQKTKDLCIMKSDNPTKNYIFTKKYCIDNKIGYDSIASKSSDEFLAMMSEYEKFLFIPTVLETFSRICAEAKMMNLKVMTNKKLIGFFSEDCSSLEGFELINYMKNKNKEALKMFGELV